MLQIELFRNIKLIADKYFSKVQTSTSIIDKVNYLKECQKHLLTYLSEKPEFIFIGLSFLTVDYDGNKRLHFINQKENNGLDFNTSLDGLDEIENNLSAFIRDFNTKENFDFISLTDVLLQSSCKDLRLFQNQSNESKPDKSYIHSINLTDTDKQSFDAHYIDSFLESYKQPKDQYTRVKTKNYFQRYFSVFQNFKNLNFSKIEINFIKPYLPFYKDNVLLTLCFNSSLEEEERTFINLVLYKILSYTAITEILENQKLRAKKDYTLTSHGLKTEIGNSLLNLSSTLKKKFNFLLKKNGDFSTLSQNINGIDKNLNQLYSITGIHSLLEKINDKESFVFSAKDDKLLQEQAAQFDVYEYFLNLNEHYEDDLDVQIKTTLDLNEIELKIYELYFSEALLKLFYGTIFENLIRYGEPFDNELVLEIYKSSSFIVFKNRKNNNVSLTKKYLRGNLRFFKDVIEETNSGSMIIDRKDPNYFYIKLQL